MFDRLYVSHRADLVSVNDWLVVARVLCSVMMKARMILSNSPGREAGVRWSEVGVAADVTGVCCVVK